MHHHHLSLIYYYTGSAQNLQEHSPVDGVRRINDGLHRIGKNYFLSHRTLSLGHNYLTLRRKIGTKDLFGNISSDLSNPVIIFFVAESIIPLYPAWKVA